MFIELHMIQNFSPSNINRDDTNNPKDCTFGGHRRARISSQSLKRAIRREKVFSDLTQVPLGKRTKLIANPIQKRLIDSGKDTDLAEAVALAYAGAYVTKKKDRNKEVSTSLKNIDGEKTSVLVFLSEAEFDLITELLIENWKEVVSEVTQEGPKVLGKLVKTLIDKTKECTSAPDIALYGRMLASDPSTNIDAACQVAHAISTHRINMEMDFYTAVDELQHAADEEGAGAGMMGFTNFNSACFYRYARVDWEQLKKNLGGNVDLTRRTVEGFLRAALDAIPTGKQNSFAAQNPTNLAMVLVREDGKSWNLANAFEEPVTPRRDSGLIRPSIEALDAYWGDLVSRRDDAEFEAISVYTDSSKHQGTLDQLAGYHQPNLSAWVNAVTEALPKE